MQRLQAEAAAAAAEHAAHLASAEAEARRQADEAAATRQRLELGAAEAAARGAERAAAAQQLQQELLRHARRHMAAWHIARAWRRYRSSPARARRAACATRIQAAWRGCAARRQAAQLRAQRAVMRGLEEAASKGMLEAMRQLAEQAQGVGAWVAGTQGGGGTHANGRTGELQCLLLGVMRWCPSMDSSLAQGGKGGCGGRCRALVPCHAGHLLR